MPELNIIAGQCLTGKPIARDTIIHLKIKASDIACDVKRKQIKDYIDVTLTSHIAPELKEDTDNA